MTDRGDVMELPGNAGAKMKLKNRTSFSIKLKFTVPSDVDLSRPAGTSGRERSEEDSCIVLTCISLKKRVKCANSDGSFVW